ncbi:MAG: hypothetical protein IH947_07695 [Bacteroidetes bacterium]|nr:hypothetical protein [Bacteroidota bacterium]
MMISKKKKLKKEKKPTGKPAVKANTEKPDRSNDFGGINMQNLKKNLGCGG